MSGHVGSKDTRVAAAPTPSNVVTTQPSWSFPLLLCLVAVHFFRIGCQLVITAWSVVGITGRSQSVGQILLISSATTLIASPFIGAWIDRSARKKPLVLAGHFGVALSGASPFVLAICAPQSSPFVGLIVATIMSSVAGITIGCAMDYYIKLSFPARSRTAKLALMNSVSQCTLIAGTAFGGYLVSFAPWQDAYLLIGGCGLALTALAAYILPSLIHTSHSARNTVRAGPALYLQHPYLFSVAFCSALAFAVGQATNTLLPAFMNLDLKLSSEHYASVEAAWSIGALAASAGLARFAKDRFGPLGHDLVIVLSIAALLSIVPRLSTPEALVAVHFVLGVGFAVTRVRADARFLSACPTHLLGRFRANSLCLTSLVSATVFISPTLSNGMATPSLYQWLSAGIAASALILMAAARHPKPAAG
ncbi:MAG TPA: MFS transporter [Trinickia sp.]|nr:MFS transporter [Trinickia sp.]